MRNLEYKLPNKSYLRSGNRFRHIRLHPQSQGKIRIGDGKERGHFPFVSTSVWYFRVSDIEMRLYLSISGTEEREDRRVGQ